MGHAALSTNKAGTSQTHRLSLAIGVSRARVALRGHTGDTRSLPALETPRELPQTLEQSVAPAHPARSSPPLSLLPEPDTPAKAKKNKGIIAQQQEKPHEGRWN